MSNDEQLTAFHEAGHALMAAVVGARVRQVTIAPDWDDGPNRFGDTQVEWLVGRDDEKTQAERMVMVALAGPVAEMIHRGEPFHPGMVAEWANDWQVAWQAAAPLHADRVPRLRLLERITRELYQQFRRDDVWAALGEVVDQLLAHETLEWESVAEAVRRWL